MPSPFPGMDPYLENPDLWSGVHAALMAAIFERLGPAVRPKYVVRYEERVYVSSPDDPSYRLIVPDLRVVERDPRRYTAQSVGGLAIAEPIQIEAADDEIHERSLTVIDVKDRAVVTVIEVLSHTNKTWNSPGRTSFIQKRREVFASSAHWMEIDLLRAGTRTANVPGKPDAEYQVFVSRAGRPRKAYVWPMPLRQRLPVIGVPLRGEDPDVALDLQGVVEAVVERGSYDLDTDYSREPVPALSPDQARWALHITQATK